MHIPTMARCACLLLAVTLTSAAAVGPLPKIEAGVGIAVLELPAYRGSDHYGTAGLPLPYIIYRGDRIKLTRQGLRARLFDTEHFNLGISGAFTVPGHRGEDPARSGMPKLDPTLEIGPTFDWTWYGDDYNWCVCVPVRAVTATNFGHWNGAGWLAHPQLRAQRFSLMQQWSVVTGISIGPVFADRRYHAYFYDVAPQFATADRPAYQARGGYSGARASIFFGARKGPWGGGIGVLGDWLGGAVFEDSPLVKTRGAVTVGVGIAYRLWSQGSAGAVEDDAP